MQQRIAYLDGLKGLAALMVVLSHIAVISYYDSYILFGTPYFGNVEASAQVLQSHPLAGVFVNGCLGFDLFFTMIAIFPILQYREEGSGASLVVAAVKRYFQLLGPCLIVCLAAVYMYQNGLYTMDGLIKQTGCKWLLAALPPTGCDTWSDFFYTVFFRMWLGDGIYHPITVVWCLCIILTGSWAVYGCYELLGHYSGRYLPGLALLILSLSYPYLSFFAMGSLLTEFLLRRPAKKLSGILVLVLILGGMVLTRATLIFYPLTLNGYYLSSLGCALIIGAIYVSPWLRHLLSVRYLTFLGELSFEIVLVHALFIANIGCLFYSWLLGYTTSSFLLMTADFVMVLLPTLPVAWLLHKYVSAPWNRWLKQCLRGLLQ